MKWKENQSEDGIKNSEDSTPSSFYTFHTQKDEGKNIGHSETLLALNEIDLNSYFVNISQ